MSVRLVSLIVCAMIVLTLLFRSGRNSAEAQHEQPPSVPAPQQASQAPTAPPVLLHRKNAQPAKGIESGDSRMQRARQIRHDDPSGAAALLEEILRESPRNELALLELGSLYALDPAKLEKAKELLEKAVSANPENERALTTLLDTYAKTGPPGAALSRLKELYDSNSGSANLTLAYGRTLASQGRKEEAAALLNKAAENSELAQGANFALGKLHESSGNPEAAVSAYGTVVANQERMLLDRQKRGEATGQLERNLVSNQLNLVSALIANREFDKAERMLHSVIAKAPDHDGVSALSKRLQVERAN